MAVTSPPRPARRRMAIPAAATFASLVWGQLRVHWDRVAILAAILILIVVLIVVLIVRAFTGAGRRERPRRRRTRLQRRHQR